MSAGPPSLDRIAIDLRRFVAAHYGAHADIDALKVMEAGHAGLTFGFRVLASKGGSEVAPLVLKLAPPGVRRAGNADVHRQAPLLRALHAAGLPVPGVPWASAEDDWFGTPFVMMEFLDGMPFFVWQPDACFDRSPAAVAPLWEQCIDVLADLHRFDWQRELADWGRPWTPRDEVERWLPTLAKSPEPDWIDAGLRLHERLLATVPAHSPLGLVHGDYQPGNALWVGGRMTGIIDWELASIGSPLLDVGWLMMAADERSWVPGWTPFCPLSPQDVVARYERATGRSHEGLAWWQALAGWRLGAIACLNVHLHRSARRPDAVWERFALAIPALFGRATELLEGHR